jgi:CPA1 family monovalent cation:H+ antiporter
MVSTELIISAFLAISLLASVLSKKTATPYTVLLVIIGIILAATSDPNLAPISQVFQNLRQGGLFVGLVLPPLLFQSMMSIRTEEFRAVSRPAIILATVGVGVATFVVGFILWYFARLPPYSAFLFAALIAPTDVATVLEIFQRTAVPGRLATLMETEAVFNDATGIILLTAVLTGFQASTSGLEVIGAFSQSVVIFGGGVVIGLLVAGGARQLQHVTQDSTTQVVLTLTAAYGSYGIASALGVSGLIAVAVTGLLYGNTVLFNIARKDVEQATREFWSILAFIANTTAFLFIGFSTNILSLGGSISFILIAYVVVMVSRLASVYPILSLPRILSTGVPWSWKNVAMLGGMRGALSIALVASLPSDLPNYTTVVNMTFGVAVISILLQGPLLSAYVGRAFGRQQTLPEVAAETPVPAVSQSSDTA